VWSYEIDIVAGYDGGLVDEVLGTRIADGRNATGDNNGIPALAARAAYHPGPSSEIGLGVMAAPTTRPRSGARSASRACSTCSPGTGATFGRTA
jgi:hypothetical protein